VELAQLLLQNPWTATAVAALLAVIAALVLHRFGRALLLRAIRGAILPRAVIEATERAAGAALPLIALQMVWAAAPNDLDYIDGVRHVNGLLLIAALTWLTLGVINGVANGVIARHPVTVADNLQARRIQTQARFLSRSAMVLVLMAGAAMALMTFPGARQFGASLLASAGVIGLVVGIAARPVFSNLIAGLQLALAQPIRMHDVLVVKGENGRVEEITGTYVVLKLWDERRMIVPLQWFIENTFENWTRTNAEVLQSVFFFFGLSTPIQPVREELQRIVKSAPEWDGRVCSLMVTDTTEGRMKVRALVSGATAGKAFELGCRVRESLLAYMAREHPQHLPRL
jgi:small-conductance mechanosensitive channel